MELQKKKKKDKKTKLDSISQTWKMRPNSFINI
jgi:hypothetical protein